MPTKREQIIEYVIDNLSANIVNLELDDAILNRNLDRALKYSSDYFSYTLYKTVSPLPAGGGQVINLSEIDEPDRVPTIVNVYPTEGIVNINSSLLGLQGLYINNPDGMGTAMKNYAQAISQLSNLESLLGRNARIVGDKLFIDGYHTSVTIEYIPQIMDIEKIIEGSWLRWLTDYTTALSMRQLAMTRGKHVVSSNPSATNAATLLEIANSELVRLETELELKGVLLARR